MLGMDMPHAHALFSHSTGPYSARRSGEARATPSVGKISAPCMIPGTSTQKKGPPWQDSRAMYPKSPDCTPKRIHGTKILPASARKAYISRKRCQGAPPFFVQSAKREYMARESCHSSQSNLEDRHNESIGRRNANPKKDPGTTAKSPNAKATLTRPLFLAARSNAQINLSPRRFPQGHQSSQHETISKTAQHQGSLEKSCLRKLIRRSSMST